MMGKVEKHNTRFVSDALDEVCFAETWRYFTSLAEVLI